MLDNLIDFETFKNKIRSFRRDELLHLATIQCWEGWRREASSVHKMDSQLFATISPRIFCLAAAYGTNFNRRSPIGYDYLKLVRSFLSVKELEMETSNAATIEEYIHLIERSEVLNALNLKPENLELVKVVSTIQRMSRPQLERHNFSDPIRGLLIFREADKIEGGGLSTRVNTLFRLSPEDFYRSALTIFALLMEKSADYNGKIALDKTFYNEHLEKKYGVNFHTLLLCASRLEINHDKIEEWKNRLIEVDDLLKKNYPIPLHDFPLYRISNDEMSFLTGRTPDDFVFMCPSPELYLASLKNRLSRYVIESSDTPKYLNKVFGDAFENYLFNCCLPNMFKTFRKIGTSDNKSADFLIETDKYNLVIECKKSLNNAVGLNLSRPIDVIETWERIFQAIQQCCYSAKNMSAESKTTVAIVICDQNILNDTNLFLSILEDINYLQESNIPYVEVMSVARFEEVFLRAEPDVVLDTIVSNWTKYRISKSKADFQTLFNSEIKYTKNSKTHLHRELEALFPSIDYPKI